LTHQGIGKIDADGLDADQDLSGAGRRRRLADKLQDFRRTEIGKFDLSLLGLPCG